MQTSPYELILWFLVKFKVHFVIVYNGLITLHVMLGINNHCVGKSWGEMHVSCEFNGYVGVFITGSKMVN